MEELFLTGNDTLELKGGMRMMYNSSLIIKFESDGSHTVLKDRYGLSKLELTEHVNEHVHKCNLDRRLLLM
jgi:hypothetical protein